MYPASIHLEEAYDRVNIEKLWNVLRVSEGEEKLPEEANGFYGATGSGQTQTKAEGLV